MNYYVPCLTVLAGHGCHTFTIILLISKLLFACSFVMGGCHGILLNIPHICLILSDQVSSAMLSNVCAGAHWQGWLLCNAARPPAPAIICMLMAHWPTWPAHNSSDLDIIVADPHQITLNTISNGLSDNRFKNIVLVVISKLIMFWVPHKHNT